MELGGHVHELVNAERDEVHEHDFHNWARTGDSGADGHAGEGRLGDGGVADTRGAIFLDESPCDAKGAAVCGDVLTHEEDARIGGKGFVEGIFDELDGREGAHA